jgi:hypothetical protein
MATDKRWTQSCPRTWRRPSNAKVRVPRPPRRPARLQDARHPHAAAGARGDRNYGTDPTSTQYRLVRGMLTSVARGISTTRLACRSVPVPLGVDGCTGEVVGRPCACPQPHPCRSCRMLRHSRAAACPAPCSPDSSAASWRRSFAFQICVQPAVRSGVASQPNRFDIVRAQVVIARTWSVVSLARHRIDQG